jgi:hypothetical protein
MEATAPQAPHAVPARRLWRTSAILIWLTAAGFGLPTVPVAVYVLEWHQLPWFFDLFPMYGGPVDAWVGPTGYALLLLLFGVVAFAEAATGVLLWRGRRAAATVSLVLLPVEVAFWVAFALPFPPMFAAVRLTLTLLAWRRTRHLAVLRLGADHAPPEPGVAKGATTEHGDRETPDARWCSVAYGHAMTEFFDFGPAAHTQVDLHDDPYTSDRAGMETHAAHYGPDIDEHDYNHDGRVDVVSADTDYDGKDDAWQYDTDNDGKIDMAGYDLNGDGSIDQKEYDHNSDGRIDEVRLDADHDNRPELRQVDTDNDGVLDRLDRDSDRDGTFDQHDPIHDASHTLPHWGPNATYGSV